MAKFEVATSAEWYVSGKPGIASVAEAMYPGMGGYMAQAWRSVAQAIPGMAGNNMASRGFGLPGQARAPCPGNCGFMQTWHPSHCCAACANGLGHHGPGHAGAGARRRQGDPVDLRRRMNSGVLDVVAETRRHALAEQTVDDRVARAIGIAVEQDVPHRIEHVGVERRHAGSGLIVPLDAPGLGRALLGRQGHGQFALESRDPVAELEDAGLLPLEQVAPPDGRPNRISALVVQGKALDSNGIRSTIADCLLTDSVLELHQAPLREHQSQPTPAN